MNRYMVMVNCKYMVAVSADSAYGAEHAILDGIYSGIQTALAFDSRDMKGDYFVNCMCDCETISYAELEKIAHDYACTIKTGQETMAEISEMEKQIAELQKKIGEKSAYLEAVRETNVGLIQTLGMRKDLGLGYAEV